MLFFVVALACEPEPGPGDVGYVECGDRPVNADYCQPISYCCEILDAAGRQACEYLTGDDVFTCEGLACAVAGDDAVDAACTFPTEMDTGQG